MNNNRSQNITNYTKLINATCVDAALKAPMQTQQDKALERGRMTSVRCLYSLFSHVDVGHSAEQYVKLAVQIMSVTPSVRPLYYPTKSERILNFDDTKFSQNSTP